MEARPKILASRGQEVALVFVACMGQFLTQGGITMSLCTMNIIMESFAAVSGQEPQSSEKVWFIGSFALTVGTFIMVSGRLGDLFGLKKIFVIGWGWVALWSLLVGLSYYSRTLTFFIICRAFQGIGFALVLPCGIGILGTLYKPGKRKNIVFCLVGACGPSGATVGAIFSSILSEFAWWPWAFWILSIVSTLCAIIAYMFVPEGEESQLSLREKLSRLDFFGTIIGVSSLIVLNFSWNHGPVVGWSKPYIPVLLGISLLGIAIFFIFEARFSSYPLIPRKAFSFKIGALLGCVGFGWGSFGIWQFYYNVICLDLREYSAVEVAVSYVPLLVLGVIAAMSVSVLIEKVNPSYVMAFSMLSFMCGCIMLSVMPISQSYFRVSMGQMFILSWGMDLSFPAASILLSDFLPREHQGMAASLVSTVINYSVSLFVGIASTIETEVYKESANELLSYRCALYFGIGIAALGFVLSSSLMVQQWLNRKEESFFFNKESRNLSTETNLIIDLDLAKDYNEKR